MTIVPAPAGDPPIVTPPAGDPPAPEPKQTPEQLQAKLEEAQKSLRAANKESADRRKRLEELEKAETDRQAASLSETEKLQKQLADANAKAAQAKANADERVIVSELKAQAASMGFTDLDYAVFKVRNKVTLTDDGAVEGADDALKELAKASPTLVKKPGQAPLNPGNPANGQTGETLAQQRARVYNSGATNLFDVKAAYDNGGGVIMDPQSPKQQP